jgi:hypothetical protein
MSIHMPSKSKSSVEGWQGQEISAEASVKLQEATNSFRGTATPNQRSWTRCWVICEQLVIPSHKNQKHARYMLEEHHKCLLWQAHFWNHEARWNMSFSRKIWKNKSNSLNGILSDHCYGWKMTAAILCMRTNATICYIFHNI